MFHSCVRAFVILFLSTLAFSGFHQARAQDSAIERFGLRLPNEVQKRQPVLRLLETLDRERCDREAIIELGEALQKAGFRRDAANALIAFSDSCNGHAQALRSATNIFLNLTDNQNAIQTATRLIQLEPFSDNGYYLRGLSYDKSGNTKKAIEDYTTAIDLFGNKAVLSSVAYVGIARNFEKLDKLCDAAHTIESWVALNAEKNDTTQSRAMITNYLQRGQCVSSVGGKAESFPIVPNQTTTVAVTVNGVRGNFIVDTGATYVSIKSSFATKAKIEIDPEISLRLNTANGVVEAARGKAAVIKARSLEAKDVAVAVQLDKNATYGDKIDGLLGMTFLSRFNVTIDARRLLLTPRRNASSKQ